MAEFIYPLDDDTAVLRPGLRRGTDERWLTRGRNENEHIRHDGTTWRHQSAGRCIAGTVKAARPERSQQALPLTLTSDIRH
ncbi:hypothetical protein F3J33_25765 [Klebsiella sp. Acro-834]|nr:hypothetical protein [Klebsiella sp. Acro-834]NIG41816.1 hypothetical protein [Klebsiella sp. Acro-833]